MEELSISQKELEKVNQIYEGIRLLHVSKDKSLEKGLSEELGSFIKSEMNKLSHKLTYKMPSSVLKLYVSETRFQLFRFCGVKIGSFMNLYNSDASKLFNQVLDELSFIFDEITNKALEWLEKCTELKNQLEEQKKETEDVLQAAESLEKSATQISEERDSLKSEIQELKQETEKQVNQLKSENRKYLEQIVKLAKQSAEHSVMSPKAKTDNKEPKRYNSPKNNLRNFFNFHTKELSLKQTKDLFEELMTNKEKYDQKCLESSQPRETLSQYLPTFFNRKYGLKSLTQEWITGLNKAIDKYSNDVEVVLFGKILKNQVNEEFYSVFQQIKNTCFDLYKQYIKTKYPYMQEKALKDYLNDKKNGDLEDEEWMTIIGGLYPPTDIKSLKEVIFRRKRQVRTPRKTKSLLPYKELVHVMLEFQLTSHEEILRPLVDKLVDHDCDQDGVLDTLAFSEVMSELNLQGEVPWFLEKLDPNQTGYLTFSDVIKGLSSENSPLAEGQVSLLHKIYNDLN